MNHKVASIDALLPQTQCTRCGYPTCRDYADAISAGRANINRCPPGGEATVEALANLLGLEPTPLDPACGKHSPLAAAVIDEPACIGCTLCIQACPVDAIVGAPKRMHTVLTVHCTGCELCVPPCPVDCIAMVPVTRLAEHGEPAARALLAQTPAQRAIDARARFEFHRQRLQRDKRERDERLAQKALAKLAAAEAEPPSLERERRKAIIEAALYRARVRREREERDRAHRETDDHARVPGDKT